MYRKSLKLFTVFLLAIPLACACANGQIKGCSIVDKPEIKEEEMDPSIEHDVQMIMDVLSLEEYKRTNVVRGVETLRNYGVGAFISIKLIDSGDLRENEKKSGCDFWAEITDEFENSYRVGFVDSGFAIVIHPPDGLGTVFIYDPIVP